MAKDGTSLNFFQKTFRRGTFYHGVPVSKKLITMQESSIIDRKTLKTNHFYVIPSTVRRVIWNKIVCVFVCVRVKGTMFFWPLTMKNVFLTPDHEKCFFDPYSRINDFLTSIMGQCFCGSCHEPRNIKRQYYHFQRWPVWFNCPGNRAISFKHPRNWSIRPIIFENLVIQPISHRKLIQSVSFLRVFSWSVTDWSKFRKMIFGLRER